MSRFASNLATGQLGESLIARWCMSRGNSLIPVYEKEIDTGKGPRFFSPEGQFVAPDDATFKSAAAAADWGKSFYQILTNQNGKDAWPITGATFILMHKVQDKPANAGAALKFFDWAYKNGDKTADDLDYVPMPASVKDAIHKSWAAIKDGSGKAIAY